MGDMKPEERQALDNAVPPGWVLHAATWERASDQQESLKVEMYPRRLAGIVGPDQESPTVPPLETATVTGTGASREDALTGACTRLRESRWHK